MLEKTEVAMKNW